MGQYYRPLTQNTQKDRITAWFNAFDFGNSQKLMDHSYVGNWLVMAVEKHLYRNPQPLSWVGDYSHTDLFAKCNECPERKVGVTPYEELVKLLPEPRFCVNHTKKEYFEVQKDGEELTIHPLPILTRLSDEGGGGDYYGTSMELVGAWAGDTIEVTDREPDNEYKRITPNFSEE